MKISFYILVLFLTLNSCEKDEPHKPIMAGVSDSDMFFFEFNPKFQLHPKPDSLLNFKYGIDSIDINLDGKFDFFISQRSFIDLNDTIRYIDDNYPYCKISVKNGLEIARRNETYYIGLGQTSNVDWVDTLQYEYRIEKITEWSESNTNIWMWVVPPTVFWGSYGTWYDLIETERYIGIRMKIDSHSKFGWIKINQISRENLEILSYAIEI